jgi:potassium inwardly-rectifying channel subfamily J
VFVYLFYLNDYRFLKDFFISMIDFSWSLTLLSFAASFYTSWLGFAVLWYILVYAHGENSAAYSNPL